MSWSKLYAFRSYARSSNWIVPFLAIVLQQVIFRAAMAFDEYSSWAPRWPLGVTGTQAALQTIISLMIAFVVFTFGSLLVAIQVASAQLTPRIIATTLLRDRVIRATVGLFIVTLLFAIGTISRIDNSVPQFTVWISISLGLISLIAFLHLIDYSARLLRPVSVVWKVANEGFNVIDEVYPDPISSGIDAARSRRDLGSPDRVMVHTNASAVILAVDLKSILTAAQGAGGVIKFAARIGDFVATGQPLFLLYGGARTIDNHRLQSTVAFGRERTIEQDLTFAFRVIVDIAIKALSKAINDPTTAVVAIDQLQRLLQRVGQRHLQNEYIFDTERQLRVVFPTPNWDDFVQLTCREIRLYGAENFQIARRLRAMLEILEQALPETRRPALRRELDLLDRTIEKVYLLEEDKALARISDTQGIGGSSGI